MPTKSLEVKAREKQMKEAQQQARVAARREHAKAVVDSSKRIGDFIQMNNESETVLNIMVLLYGTIIMTVMP